MNMNKQYAVSIRDGADLLLIVTLARGQAGDVYVNICKLPLRHRLRRLSTPEGTYISYISNDSLMRVFSVSLWFILPVPRSVSTAAFSSELLTPSNSGRSDCR